MNKNSATPLYQQVADEIKQQIFSGQLKENDKLMTEFELSEYYNVSRITVRKAFELLVEEGYVIKRQGIGTFVAARKLNRVADKILSFTEMCEREGRVPSAEVISAEWIHVPLAVSRALRLDEHDRVLRLVRLRKSDDKPVMLEESFYPSQFSFLLSEDLTGSTYAMMRRRGIIPAHAIKTVEICFADSEETERLELKNGQVLLLHKDLMMDEKEQPIHYSKLIINPERYRLTIVF